MKNKKFNSKNKNRVNSVLYFENNKNKTFDY